MTTSSSDIAEVSAPTKRAAKNMRPTNLPAAPMAMKALGRLMKSAPMALSPISRDKPNAKITGNTTNPAKNATPKSETAMVAADAGRFSSRDR